MDLCSKRPDIDARFAAYPFLTAEMGGGMEMSYHRRPVMTADDIAAVDIAKLGSGVTLYGYYMFHGGTNPDGKRTHACRNRKPRLSQRRAGEDLRFSSAAGRVRADEPVLSRSEVDSTCFLRISAQSWHRWSPTGPTGHRPPGEDRQTPRLAARSNGKSGFLFHQ